MALLLTMLPVYILGNLHCLGMCGPLVMFLGSHPHRHLYFLGRTLSFTLVATAAGEMGAVLNASLQKYQLQACASFGFGAFFALMGVWMILGRGYPGQGWIAASTRGIEKRLSAWLIERRPGPAFLFGLFTVALPCGQTLFVFSACAMEGSALSGMVNGMAFALLTSPSLWVAMHAHCFIQKWRGQANQLMGGLAIIVGILACLRGLAEWGTIDHLVLNPSAEVRYHVVLY